MEWLFSLYSPEVAAFFQVVLIDLSLAGDNALVIGLAAAGLEAKDRRRAIFYGVLGATLLRVLFALGTAYFLSEPGWTLLGGGILLCWVAWKMYRQIRQHAEPVLENSQPHHKAKNLREAITQIIIADVSMSLDNVLAVAGAAREHSTVLVLGLVLSVLLMGAAATTVERLLRRYPALAYIGLLIIIYVAGRMIWDGATHLIAQ